MNRFLTALALVLVLTVSAVAIDFHPTIDQARATAVDAAEGPRPLVITFGGAWCPWCRKMEADTFLDERVTAQAGEFLWVKVDVDEQPELAARFRVEGLPQTFVLNGEDRMIAARAGYIPPEAFVAFLQEALNNPQPAEDLLHDLLLRLSENEPAEEHRETLTRLVEHLARPDRDARRVILSALAEAGPDTWPMLVELMSDDRLSVRAAAAGALMHLSRADLSFDPFAERQQRQVEAESWRDWLASRPQ